jgi:phosphate transport system permease protein
VSPLAEDLRAQRIRQRQIQRWIERGIEACLWLAASTAVAVTVAIVGVLLIESAPFFIEVGLWDFLAGTEWTPLFENPRYGIWPLLSGTLTTTLVAVLFGVPLGVGIAVYLSELASARLREVVKPLLELLAGVPTVVFGYLALMFVTPALQSLIPGLPGFNMLSAGLVVGVMIVPYVSSLSEDALRAVSMDLREASYALGAGRLRTALWVVLPAAVSGVVAASVLAVSRAAGETLVVAIAAGQQPNFGFDPTEGGATLTSYIVQVALGDLPPGSLAFQSLFACGLLLFLMTLGFNLAGHALRRRYRESG